MSDWFSLSAWRQWWNELVIEQSRQEKAECARQRELLKQRIKQSDIDSCDLRAQLKALDNYGSKNQ